MSTMNPRDAYAANKASAEKRGIEFDLTFEEWWAIWQPRFAERGLRADDLQLCRVRDEGGYTVGNVRIDTQRANAAEAGLVRRVRSAPLAYRGVSTAATAADPAAGWMWRKNVFAPYSEDDSEDA